MPKMRSDVATRFSARQPRGAGREDTGCQDHYNGARHLAEQLASIVGQTLLPDELVIGDDGSTDDTLAIVYAFAARAPFPVRVVDKWERPGFSDNFLNTAETCEHEIIAFCDQDDVWLPNKLEVCAKRLEEDNSLIALHALTVTDEMLRTTGLHWSQGPDVDRVFEPLEFDLYYGPHDELADVPGEFQQSHVIAAPGHPFLRAVLERVIAGIATYSIRHTGVGSLGVLRLTGPIAYTRAIVLLLNHYPCRRVADERGLLLEYSVLDRSRHQSLFASHYVGNTSPVARRPGIKGFFERRYVQVQALGPRTGDRP